LLGTDLFGRAFARPTAEDLSLPLASWNLR